MYDVIVIGAGPAGVSAALYAKRAGLNILVLYHGESNLEKATQIDNYYGFVDGIDGKTLYENGIEQAKHFEIEVKNEEVLHIEKENGKFTVCTVLEQYEGKAVILATGNKKLRPNVKGVLEFEGKGISYCAICDGFFYRNKNVVVIGNGKFALNEAKELKNVAKQVTILSNGLAMEDSEDFEIKRAKIKEIHGDSKVKTIELEDGTELNIDGVFIALGEAGGSDFAKKMGVMLDHDNIIVDENMQTNMEGLYSCGNSTGGLLQVCKAAYEGAKAGLAAANYIRS
ncbi:MAG: NAD(P)/FAD-dependent oxidoreductase [Clostridia bacterium]|nr:NAD(P)/FAD-dependent oxidoreductase [Clostridia bacterium]